MAHPRLTLAALAACAGCASEPSPVATAVAPARAAPVKGTPVALRNAGFEEPMAAQARCAPAWNCKMHNDPDSFRFFLDEKRPASGARSFCVERVGREPWALATQVVDDIAAVRGRHVRFTASVRMEGVVGDGAGPFILAQGGSGQTLVHGKEQDQGTRYWNRMSVELTVPQEAFILEVGLVLEGRGLACIDDAQLELIK
jgi:hypothetical protein